MNCMLFFDAIIWIIEHNQWLDRVEASELQMKREEFIYLRILDKKRPRIKVLQIRSSGCSRWIAWGTFSTHLFSLQIYKLFVNDSWQMSLWCIKNVLLAGVTQTDFPFARHVGFVGQLVNFFMAQKKTTTSNGKKKQSVHWTDPISLLNVPQLHHAWRFYFTVHCSSVIIFNNIWVTSCSNNWRLPVHSSGSSAVTQGRQNTSSWR